MRPSRKVSAAAARTPEWRVVRPDHGRDVTLYEPAARALPLVFSATWPFRTCACCGDGLGQLACERCGVRLHELCYWRRVPIAELAAYADGQPYTFICPGCRA